MESARPSSHGETAELHSGSSFRNTASRLLRPKSATNHDHPAIQYAPAQTHEVDEQDYQDRISSTVKRPAHVSHDSIQATSTGNTRSDKASQVFWNGLPLYALTWELFGIIISILFLILGAFVVNLKDRHETGWSKSVIQATRIAPSVWPILFSGVLGNAVRRFADWRAERGVKLLALEQLMGSLTMAGSVTAIFAMSIFEPVSFVLILLWAFNPLGSQASFRGVYLKDVVSTGTGQVMHYSPNLSFQMNLTMWSFGRGRTRPTVRALYSALLYDVIANTQYVDPNNATYEDTIMKLGGPQVAGIQSAMDTWGNLRIPHLEYAANYNPSSPTDWVSIPWTEAVQNYSSLAGDRFEGVDRSVTGNTTFNITSSYQTLTCAPWIRLEESQVKTWTLQTFGYNYSTLIDANSATGVSTKNRNFPRTYFAASSAGTAYNRTYPGAPKLVFGVVNDMTNTNELVSYTSCTSGTTYVDAQVECRSQGTGARLTCGVQAMRKMSTPPESADVNLLEPWRVREDTGVNIFPQVQNWFLDGFMDLMDENSGGTGVSSMLEWYIQDPLAAFGAGSDNMQSVPELWNMDVKLVEKRLSLLYNTLWKIGWTYKSINGGNWTADEGLDNLSKANSRTLRPLEPIYVLDVSWLVLYFISVGVMFLAAVVSLVLHWNCTAPPILGYVSSLVRDSVFFSDSGVQGNSLESGTSKASRLRNMEVKIADVWSEENVGRVAFAPAQGRGAVGKGRWYE